uniref:hypothetical protein n=1 Tax=Roseivirga sp. TaxID=1964215 RepID=UPI004048B113
MIFSSYKYKRLSSNFNDPPKKVDFKGCLIYFLILVIIVIVVHLLSKYFGWD